jgi:predicted esterase
MAPAPTRTTSCLWGATFSRAQPLSVRVAKSSKTVARVGSTDTRKASSTCPTFTTARTSSRTGIGPDATWNLLGYSNGANIAHSLLRTHPGLVGDVVLLRPMVIDPDDRAERLKGHRALVAAGRHDLIVPLASAEALAAELRRGGADVDLSVAAAGHELTEFDFLRVRAWLSHR